MGRQSVQRTESNAHDWSASAKRLRTRPARSTRSADSPQARPQAQTARSQRPKARQKRPSLSGFLCVFGLWALLLVAAVLASRSLLDPTVVSSTPAVPAAAETSPETPLASAPSQEEPTPSKETALSDVTLDNRDFYPSSEADRLPIVALGSIAISCAMGCILIARAMHPRRSPPRFQGRAKKLAAAKSAASQSTPFKSASLKKSASYQSAQLKQLPSAAVQPVLPQSALAVSEAAQKAQKQAEAATAAIVTILPAEQSLPLDWDEPSLADSLDLRQRRSFPF